MSKKHAAPGPGTVIPGGVMQTAPPRVVGKPHAHAKPHKPAPGPGGPMVPAPAARSRKHAGGRKHKRGLALGEAVACCAAEALAASLRLTGWPVSDADVLALYEMTAGSPDEGASIEDTLEAARRRGWPDGTRTRKLRSQAVSASTRLLGHTAPDSATAPGHPFAQGSALILGLELPEGPHAVYDDGTAWWSWGQPYDPASFPGAVIEEAWQVRWAR